MFNFKVIINSWKNLGCDFTSIENGVCDDRLNHAECNFDGGDCCGYGKNSECYHKDICTAGGFHPLVRDGLCNKETNNEQCNFDGGDCCTNPNLVANGFCNDETNNAACNYDGGDCCININKNHCSQCSCLVGGVITTPGFPENYQNNLDLTWHIQVPIGQFIEVNFRTFDIEYSSTCR